MKRTGKQSRNAIIIGDTIKAYDAFIKTFTESGRILSRIYDCTMHGDQPMDNATIAHFTLHVFILQLHVKICPVPNYTIAVFPEGKFKM